MKMKTPCEVCKRRAKHRFIKLGINMCAKHAKLELLKNKN